MNKKVKELSPKIWEEIKNSKNILLHNHPSPDADSVGGSLALMHFLESLGKLVRVIAGDSKTPEDLKHLPGVEKIRQKNFFQIDLSKFDLFLILDSSNKDMVSREDEVVFPKNLKTIVLDHHTSNKGFGAVNLICPEYIATCLLIYDLLKLWRVDINPNTAVCLLVGIYFDSGGFKYFPTDSNTFLAAAELSKVAPDYHKTIMLIENSSHPKDIEFLKLGLNSINHYFSDKVAVSEIRFEDLEAKGITEENIDKAHISNILKSVIGWDVAVSLIEIKPGLVNVGLRTRNPETYDLSKLALALGGGGHPGAAGATIEKPFNEAKEILLEAIKICFPDINTL